MPNSVEISINKKDWVYFIVIWLVAQILFVSVNGIYGIGQQENIKVADLIVNGDFHFGANNYLYLLNSLILTLFKILHLPPKTMYLVQLAIGTAGYLSFLKLCITFPIRVSVLKIAAILFCFCPFFQNWTSSLSTDYNFANLIIIILYLLQDNDKNNRSQLLLILCLCILPFSRPIGFLIIPVALYYWIFNSTQKHPKKIILFTGYLFFTIGISAFSLTKVPNWYHPEGETQAQIICGIPSNLTQYIQTPYEPGQQVSVFLAKNPLFSFQLFSNRLIRSYWLTRPYNSFKHNLAIVLTLVPYYLLVILGIFSFFKRKLQQQYAYLLLGVIVFSIPLMLFCADWANRFILPCMGILLIFMALGVNLSLDKFEILNRGMNLGAPLH